MPLTFNGSATDTDGDPEGAHRDAQGVHQFEITKLNPTSLPPIDPKKASKRGSKGGSKKGSTAGWLTDRAGITAETLVGELTTRSVNSTKKLVLVMRVPFKGVKAPKFQSVLWTENKIETLRINILDCLSDPKNPACKPTLVKAVEVSGITVTSVIPSHENDQGLGTKYVDCTMTVAGVVEVELASAKGSAGAK